MKDLIKKLTDLRVQEATLIATITEMLEPYKGDNFGEHCYQNEDKWCSVAIPSYPEDCYMMITNLDSEGMYAPISDDWYIHVYEYLF